MQVTAIVYRASRGITQHSVRLPAGTPLNLSVEDTVIDRLRRRIAERFWLIETRDRQPKEG